jgi:hypothetical protein
VGCELTTEVAFSSAPIDDSLVLASPKRVTGGAIKRVDLVSFALVDAKARVLMSTEQLVALGGAIWCEIPHRAQGVRSFLQRDQRGGQASGKGIAFGLGDLIASRARKLAESRGRSRSQSSCSLTNARCSIMQRCS